MADMQGQFPPKARKEVIPIRTAVILETGGRLFPLLRPVAEKHNCRLLRSAGEKCALLLAAPDLLTPAPETVCRILLTPPDKLPLLKNVRARWIVSYGASARESVSFSSLTEDGLTLSVRRTLPTLSGEKLEAQERPMRCPPGAPEEMLAYCAAVLLLGGADTRT